METSIQNGAMAAGYALLVFLILQHPLKRELRILLLACVLSTAFNIAYDSAVHLRWATTGMLLVRLLPPLEGCWRLARRDDCRTAISCLAGVILVVVWMNWGDYWKMRLLTSLAVGLVCLSTWGTHSLRPFRVVTFWGDHLRLQTFWTFLHVLFTLTSPWYTQTWARRSIARWVYTLAALGLVLAYRRLFKNPQAPWAAAEAWHHRRIA